MIIPVILSGGTGTRLWPLSRELYPKQLLSLIGEKTLLQETIERLDGVADLSAPLVICNETHRFMVAEQLRTLGTEASAIVLEPAGRNTAPAAAAAAMIAIDRFVPDGRRAEDPLLLVLPADHVIKDHKALHEAIRIAAAEATSGSLVTFGVVPTRAETGYGYIHRGEELDTGAFGVAEFVEKPDAARAEQFVKSKDYYWNSGMFLFGASTYLKELRKNNPEMVEACQVAVAGARDDLDFLRLDRDAFERCPADSIDYAVMEHTDSAVVVPLDAGWSDVGSFATLHETGAKDASSNVFKGDVLAEDTEGSYVHATHRMIATVGLRDHVVIETSDAVLVAPKNKTQDVKKIVERLKNEGREEAKLHRQVFRPWGSYDSVDAGQRFQVKRLIIKPGAVLSLQMHHHRAEHWVVVQGTAKVTRGDDVFLLGENESTYVPMGTKHRLENSGMVDVHIIEVQWGSYLGEDDIIRFEDTYGRSSDD